MAMKAASDNQGIWMPPKISRLCSLHEGPVPQGTHHFGTHPAISAEW